MRPAGSARSENAGGGVWQRCNGVARAHLGCGDRRFGARTVSGGVPSGTADWLTKTNSKLRPPRCTAKPTSSSDSTGYPWISTSRASSGTLRPAACAGLASITPCTSNSAESLPSTASESCSHRIRERGHRGALWLTAPQTPPEQPCPGEDRPHVQDESGRLATPASEAPGWVQRSGARSAARRQASSPAGPRLPGAPRLVAPQPRTHQATSAGVRARARESGGKRWRSGLQPPPATAQSPSAAAWQPPAPRPPLLRKKNKLSVTSINNGRWATRVPSSV